MTPLTANASFSRLSYYQNCPRAYQYKYIAKLKEPKRPDADDPAKESAAERGSRIHEACEEYVKTPDSKDPQLISELLKIEQTLKQIRKHRINHPDLVLLEQKWYFNEDYKIISTKEAQNDGYHLLAIADAFWFIDDTRTEAFLLDYKSGKRYGNENKHQRQIKLYALAAFHKFPELEKITSQLEYTDLGKSHRKDYFRNSVLAQSNYWDEQIKRMRDDLVFTPNPNTSSCMFCSWGLKKHSNKWVNKSGDCKESLDKRDYQKMPQPKTTGKGNAFDLSTKAQANNIHTHRKNRKTKEPYEVKFLGPVNPKLEIMKRKLEGDLDNTHDPDGDNTIRKGKFRRNDYSIKIIEKTLYEESKINHPVSNKDFDCTN